MVTALQITFGQLIRQVYIAVKKPLTGAAGGAFVKIHPELITR